MVAYSPTVIGAGSPPSDTMRLVISSEAMMARISLLMRSMIGCGVPAGAAIP